MTEGRNVLSCDRGVWGAATLQGIVHINKASMVFSLCEVKKVTGSAMMLQWLVVSSMDSDLE